MTIEQELALAALRHEEIRTEVADGLDAQVSRSVVLNDTVFDVFDEMLEDDLDLF